MPNKTPSVTNFAFFGSSNMSVFALSELEELNLLPSLIITTIDKPVGRKQILTPNPVKVWAKEKNIAFLDPVKLDESFIDSLKKSCENMKINIFLVASYGKIIPNAILEIPKYKTLNIHPSLLPQYRGPSPLGTAILDDQKTTGVTIVRLDEEMDHGPIIAQEKMKITEWPVYEEFEEFMARAGARLFAKILPDWVSGKIPETEQDHSSASYTKKMTKEDGELDLSDDPYLNFRKIQAYHEWPQAYFFQIHGDKKIRVKISSAQWHEGKLKILKVIPEGKKEMSYEDFLNGYAADQK